VRRCAVVTGASSGIGRALALSLARRDFEVVAVARRGELLEQMAEEASRPVHCVEADVATTEGRQKVRDKVSELGAVSVLVHNAAVVQVGALADTSDEDWRRVFEINLHAPFFLSRDLLPHMSPGSRILHVSSGAAHRAISKWGPYCVSKAALHMLYECLRDELAGREIWVASARPGIVDTPMQTTLRDRLPGEEGATYRGWYEKRRAAPPATLAPPPEGGLDTAENSAGFLTWLLTDTEPAEFSEAEWEIRDTKHHHRWVGREF
jgi:benzil reductase ((S)-benzoin forming)